MYVSYTLEKLFGTIGSRISNVTSLDHGRIGVRAAYDTWYGTIPYYGTVPYRQASGTGWGRDSSLSQRIKVAAVCFCCSTGLTFLRVEGGGRHSVWYAMSYRRGGSYAETTAQPVI
jgi:hypothetical protein